MLNKRRKKMAADVRAESSDAHVRDLQSKYSQTLFVAEKKRRLHFGISCFYDYYAPKLWVCFVCAHFIFYGRPYPIDFVWNFIRIPDAQLTFVAGIRCANIYYCSDSLLRSLILCVRQTNRNISSICGWQFKRKHATTKAPSHSYHKTEWFFICCFTFFMLTHLKWNDIVWMIK